MKLQDELAYLKGFIKLTEQQSLKRDSIEKFLEDRNKVILLDADSLLFNVVHYNIDTEYETDLEKQYEDFHSQVRSIANQIEEDGFNVADIIYFFTTCTKNFRKEIDPEYKANRPQNKTTHLVSLLKHYTIQMLESEHSDIDHVFYSHALEADDLIIDYKRWMGWDRKYIICSLDKDLKQIEGAHFDYYRKKSIALGEDGHGDVYGVEVYQYKGWSYTTKEHGYHLFCKQVLTGDVSDGIKGIHGIGEKKAEKLLADKKSFSKLLTVARKYQETDGNLDRFKRNYKLIKL